MVNLKALEMFNEWFKSKKEKHLKKLMISDKDYKELKEMYDWERKVEFNKELLSQNIEIFFKYQGNNNFYMTESGPQKIDKDTMFNDMWNMMNESGYDDPPSEWVPLNPRLRISSDMGKPPFDFEKYMQMQFLSKLIERPKAPSTAYPTRAGTARSPVATSIMQTYPGRRQDDLLSYIYGPYYGGRV